MYINAAPRHSRISPDSLEFTPGFSFPSACLDSPFLVPSIVSPRSVDTAPRHHHIYPFYAVPRPECSCSLRYLDAHCLSVQYKTLLSSDTRYYNVLVPFHTKPHYIAVLHDAIGQFPIYNDTLVLFEHVAKAFHIATSFCIHHLEVWRIAAARFLLRRIPFFSVILANIEYILQLVD